MKFTSQICTTKEQSERLLALGLKKKTADMAWVDNALTEDYEDWKVTPIEELDEYDWDINYIPAWSLHRLMEIMYSGDIYGYTILQVHNRNIGTIYECVIAHIKTLIEINHFNKEYLEEI